MTRVVVFGAGEAGRAAISQFDDATRVVAVADNDKAKQGGTFCGHPVVSDKEIEGLEPDLVVVASMYWRAIAAQLEEIGIPKSRIQISKALRGVGGGAPASFGTRDDTAPEWMVPDFSSERERGDDPLVSVAMPTRDRAPVLSRAIDSVLGQSYGNFELLIVDDGSEDGSSELLERYAKADERVKVFRQGKLGVSAARNRCLAEACGELVAYLDSDNRWHPDYLTFMAEGFARTGRMTGYAGVNVFDWNDGRCVSEVRGFDYEQLRERNWIDLNVFMHRIRLSDELGGFDEGMTRLVDWELILRFTRVAPPFVMPCVLADYYKDRRLNRISEMSHYEPNRERIVASVSREAKRLLRKNGPMRVAMVQYEFPVVSQTFVQNEIARLLEAGLQVSVFYFREAFVVAEVPREWDVARYRSKEELAWLMAARGIDVAHTHFAMPHVSDYLKPVCERLGVPFTVKPHAFDIFRRDHDPRHHIGRTGTHPLCAKVFCEGSYHERFLEGEGVPKEKLKVARNVFEREAYDRVFREPREEARSVVCISRFVEKKGLPFLVKAFRRVEGDDLRLDLYGYGEERERLVALAEGDSRIGIHDGPRSPKETAALLAQADLFALPCIRDRNGDTDGLPTVLMEAMAAGVPVLTTPVASTPDLVIDGKTGLLMESESVDATEAGLRRALGLGRAERQLLASRALDHLRAEFDPARNVGRLVEEWRRLVPDGSA